MNIVLMTSRSGSSLVCKILAYHGLKWQWKKENPTQVNGKIPYFTYENPKWKKVMKSCAPNKKWPLGTLVPATDDRVSIIDHYYKNSERMDFIKIGVEFAALWMAHADMVGYEVNFIKVRRPPEDVAKSLRRRGVGGFDKGLEVAQRRFKLMDMVPGVDVHTNLLVANDPVTVRRSGIYEALRSCGVTPSQSNIKNAIMKGALHV